MGRAVNLRIFRHHGIMSGGAALRVQIGKAVSSRAATVPFFCKKEVCNSEKRSFEEEKNTFLPATRCVWWQDLVHLRQNKGLVWRKNGRGRPRAVLGGTKCTKKVSRVRKRGGEACMREKEIV